MSSQINDLEVKYQNCVWVESCQSWETEVRQRTDLKDMSALQGSWVKQESRAKMAEAALPAGIHLTPMQAACPQADGAQKA